MSINRLSSRLNLICLSCEVLRFTERNIERHLGKLVLLIHLGYIYTGWEFGGFFEDEHDGVLSLELDGFLWGGMSAP